MLKSVKGFALGTRMAWGVINRRHLISIATLVARANNLDLLKEYGGNLVLADKWVTRVLKKLTWSKHKGTTGKVFLPLQYFGQGKVHFSEKHINISF